MDFIERSLGFAPDNGSGGLELLLLVVGCMAIVAVVSRVRRAQRDRKRFGV